MADFTFDTSGEVRTRWDMAVQFQQLDAFTQGYVEALLIDGGAGRGWSKADRLDWPEKTARHVVDGSSPPLPSDVGFSDLSPEALAMILADCEAFNLKIGDASHNPGIGAQFWKARQAGFNAHWSRHQKEFVAAFPPLSVALTDAGKVALS